MITLNNLDPKHERRIRLVFSRPLAVSAFGVPAPAAYIITNTDSLGSSPGVSAAMIVSGTPAVVELALTADLVTGASYTVSAIGIAGDDASVTDGTAILPFRFGRILAKPNVEPLQRNNNDDLVYGIDLLWNVADYQETASGDLDRIGGTANVTKALYRALESEGLTWDRGYGAKMRSFVDSPSPTAGTMKGAALAQVIKDPRVKKAKAAISTEDEKTYLVIDPTLISGADIKPVSLVVPN